MKGRVIRQAGPLPSTQADDARTDDGIEDVLAGDDAGNTDVPGGD